MTASVMTANKPGSRSLVEKYALLIFVVLVYGLTWPFFIVEVLASRNMLSSEPPVALMILQGFMPGLAAVIVTGLTRGRAGIRALFQKVLIARVGFQWYVFAIFIMGAISVSAILLANWIGTSPSIPLVSTRMPPASGPVGLLLNVVMLFIFSALFNSEELGWRGFALPRLQAKYNALMSSLILSIPWLFFHLPLFFRLGSSQADSSFISYAIQMMANTVLFTWMYNHTRGSILLPWILHASMNTWTQIFSINSEATSPVLGWMLTGVFVLAAIAVTFVSGAENLARTNQRVQE